MRHYAISAAIVSLAWVAGAAVPCTNHVALGQGATSTAPAQSAYDAGALPLPQGWEAGEIRWWYHVSQGTALMPYDWFIALEQPPLPLEQPQPGEQLFKDPAYLARLGFLTDPGPQNPDGLPVGFSRRKPIDSPDQPPYTCWKGDWVGFGCAACHTGQVNYQNHQIRIEGGPAQHDLEAFGDLLGAALAMTLASPPRFKHFADRVLPSGSRTERDLLRENLGCFIESLAKTQLLFDSAQLSALERPTPPGFGRLDAVHRGGNFLLAATLGEPRNYKPTTAPVSFPTLWDTPYFDWVLYNASVARPLERNVIEALATFAPIDPRTILTEHVDHGVDMDTIVSIHHALEKLRSPQWPEDKLGPIVPAKRDRGEKVYGQHCEGCHYRIDRESHAVIAGRPTAVSATQLRIPMIPVDEVGTDAQHAHNFAKRMMSLEKVKGPPQIAYYKAAGDLSNHIVEQWAKQSSDHRQEEQHIDGDRPVDFRPNLGYRARPLNGIWATAPYLHNGSVPTLYELLLPPQERRRIFYMGNWEFDPVRVGLLASNPFPGSSTFDTRLPGNSNAGHDYGTDLSEDQRMDLLEFLKSL